MRSWIRPRNSPSHPSTRSAGRDMVRGRVLRLLVLAIDRGILIPDNYLCQLAFLFISRPMSELNDPRVLFAAERTLLAWSRTSAGLMAFGFLVDRAGLVINGPATARDFGFWIGLAFILVGVLVCPLSVIQYHRSVAQLRPVEIPPGYWVNLSTFMSIAIGLPGLPLAIHLVVG